MSRESAMSLGSTERAIQTLLRGVWKCSCPSGEMRSNQLFRSAKNLCDLQGNLVGIGSQASLERDAFTTRKSEPVNLGIVSFQTLGIDVIH